MTNEERKSEQWLNVRWLHGDERFVNGECEQLVNGEHEWLVNGEHGGWWTKVVGEEWTKNCEGSVESERIMHGEWTVSAWTMSREMGKVEHFRDCTSTISALKRNPWF